MTLLIYNYIVFAMSITKWRSYKSMNKISEVITSPKSMKIYITKYALTTGIKEIDIENRSVTNDTIYFCNNSNYYQHYRGNDWHTTLESAILRAKDMKKRKIKSLEKTLERIKNLEIEVVKVQD